MAITSYFQNKLNSFLCIHLLDCECTSDFVVSLQNFLHIVHDLCKNPYDNQHQNYAEPLRWNNSTRLVMRHDMSMTKTSKPLAKKYSIAILLGCASNTL